MSRRLVLRLCPNIILLLYKGVVVFVRPSKDQLFCTTFLSTLSPGVNLSMRNRLSIFGLVSVFVAGCRIEFLSSLRTLIMSSSTWEEG